MFYNVIVALFFALNITHAFDPFNPKHNSTIKHIPSKSLETKVDNADSQAKMQSNLTCEQAYQNLLQQNYQLLIQNNFLLEQNAILQQKLQWNFQGSQSHLQQIPQHFLR